MGVKMEGGMFKKQKQEENLQVMWHKQKHTTQTMKPVHH